MKVEAPLRTSSKWSVARKSVERMFHSKIKVKAAAKQRRSLT